jgi:thiol-disulfide isomerase/thioredoxin
MNDWLAPSRGCRRPPVTPHLREYALARAREEHDEFRLPGHGSSVAELRLNAHMSQVSCLQLVVHLTRGVVAMSQTITGRTLPDATVITTSGTESRLRTVLDGRPAAVFFMRASSCPVCLGHARTLAGMARELADHGTHAVVVVPGGQAEAASVTGRVGPASPSSRATRAPHTPPQDSTGRCSFSTAALSYRPRASCATRRQPPCYRSFSALSCGPPLGDFRRRSLIAANREAPPLRCVPMQLPVDWFRSAALTPRSRSADFRVPRIRRRLRARVHPRCPG